MKKILIIEDDEAIVFLYKMVLTKRNYQVDVAVDGEDGLAKANAIRPDLIMLDFMMPKKNGLQVLEELKANPQLRNIPVYVLSSIVESSIEQKMLELGAVKYLVKSQTLPNEMADTIDNYFYTQAHQK